MDMSMMGNGASMNMGAGVPGLPQIQKDLWTVIGTVIAFATVGNIINYVLYRQRLSAARKGLPTPAKPKSWFFVAIATTTAILREASNASFMPLSLKGRVIRVPTFGRTFLITTYCMILIVLCFYGLNPKDRWAWEDLGYRTGWVSIAQLPLIFLLAGKNNVIGYLTGTGYERLNWMHRWVARCLLLTATIHVSWWFRDWWPFGDYPREMIKTNPQANRGFVAWILLLWIVLSSFAPIRGWRYEFFVIQHLISFTGLIVFIYLHAFPETRIWVWIPVGLYLFDRTLRGVLMLYTNLSIFHPKQRKQGTMSGVWACKADFVPLAHNTTKITIRNPPISWSPGQHVFVSCHSIVPLQSHPFTISSIPEDGEMVFVVKAENGGTKRFLHHAEKQEGIPLTKQGKGREVKTVAIQGPYGTIRPLRQFDSVVFLAGTTGATYTMPLLRDLVRAWQVPTGQPTGLFTAAAGSVTRHIRFVWVVKSRGQLEWFAEQLSGVMEDAALVKAQKPDTSMEISIYVTCDDSFTEEYKFLLTSKDDSAPPKAAVKAEPLSEKDLKQDLEVETREVDTASETSTPPPAAPITSCGPNGTCCCKTTVEEEDPSAPQQQCCCCGPSTAAPTTAPLTSPRSITSSTSSRSQRLALHPAISVLSGRPQCRNIVRRTLEQARGESAVVVCGPKGLIDDVRQSVVRLSDERAVHKGTGAQGIYLHAESFCF